MYRFTAHSGSATSGWARYRSHPSHRLREQRLEKRTGEPQDDEERADVADQQVLRHVAEEKLSLTCASG